jgi:acetate kinase
MTVTIFGEQPAAKPAEAITTPVNPLNVLVLNAGSSTLKFRLLRIEGKREADEKLLARGLVEKWGTSDARLKMQVEGGADEERGVAAETTAHAAEHAIEACKPLGIQALGHRVVHGGPRFREPARISQEVIEALRGVSHLAPLHNGLALAGIEAGMKLLPETPAFAVFDTAFHQTIPEYAAIYAIPRDLAEKHSLRRYGFHGISHRYVSGKLIECLNRPVVGSRVITCHLGNGASVCAVRDGHSVDTSMGLTPMEGLVMGTRSGDIDPGLMLHLMSVENMGREQLDELLNRKSGLMGLSGKADMREVEKAAHEGDMAAELAMEIFAYRLRKYIGAYAVVLGGVNGIAFSGGIGEHSVEVRKRVCNGLHLLGLHLDEGLNSSVTADTPTRISSSLAGPEIWVIPTDEERQIAREVAQILSAS